MIHDGGDIRNLPLSVLPSEIGFVVYGSMVFSESLTMNLSYGPSHDSEAQWGGVGRHANLLATNGR